MKYTIYVSQFNILHDLRKIWYSDVRINKTNEMCFNICYYVLRIMGYWYFISVSNSYVKDNSDQNLLQ